MDVESLRQYCLQKPHTTESFPFDEVTLVFKVHGKVFAIIGLEWENTAINLKCDPEKAIELRETYPGMVIPGYHSNKRHWNTVYTESLSPLLVKEWIDHSYDLVFAKLPKRLRDSQ
ncbi:MAG: MmcQ/YjbR family DNA-binding protein [Flavobacteriales bacterium]|nr:MAG: MmcQ/YjbR family DNA-binding protein [Flavobacteriales bacterium]